jgi:hypothetical protein
MLEDRFGNRDRGGTRPPVESNECFLTGLSGDCANEVPVKGDGCGWKLSWDTEVGTCGRSCVAASVIGDGERSLRAPKNV